MRLIDHFDMWVEAAPDRIFVHDGGRSVSYREAQTISCRIANALRRDGIGPAAKIAIYSRNSAEVCLAALGILRAGCVWTSFDNNAAPDDVAAALNRLDVDAIFYSGDYAETAETVRPACPGVAALIRLDGPDGLEAWLGDADDAFAEVPYDPDDLATIFSSGGTTGTPKGVMASHRNWDIGLQATLNHTPHDAPVDALLMPLTYVAGASALLYGMAKGTTFIIVHRFDPESLMRMIEEMKVTLMLMPPTVLNIMLTHPRVGDYDYSSLRAMIYGAGPTPPATVLKAMKAFGNVLITGFAQTETTAAVTVLDQADHAEALATGDMKRLESCGRVLPQFELKTMDEDGNILPDGEAGEVVIRGESLMLGYYKNPEETALVSRNGWHRTGDIGRKDADGYVYLLDRAKDMIISRGHKIFPWEIERVLYEHPAVQACAVVGAPDQTLGETARAVISLKPDHSVEKQELRDFCMARLGMVKTPAGFDVWDELPTSRAGKVLRKEIRAKFWEGRERAI